MHLLQLKASDHGDRSASKRKDVSFYGLTPAPADHASKGGVVTTQSVSSHHVKTSNVAKPKTYHSSHLREAEEAAAAGKEVKAASFYGIAPATDDGVRMASSPEKVEELAVTKSKSWFDRMRKSLVGVLVGLALLLIAPIALIWGELWYVTQTRFVGRARDSTMANVTTSELRRSLDGRIVHMVGSISTKQGCTDPETGVSDGSAIRMSRKVEVLQWHEDKEESKEEETFTYELRWSEEDIDSSEFEQPTGHRNPPRAKPIYSKSLNAPDARLGVLSCDEVLSAMDLREPGLWATSTLSPAFIHFPDSKGAESPKAGDVRVSYRACRAPCQASVVAVQEGERLRSVHPSDVNLGDEGNAMLLVEPGDVSKPAMFSKGMGQLRLINWAIRIIGGLFIMIGIYLVLHPVAELISFLPLLDSILKHAFAFFAVLCGLVLTPMFIALGWVYARPLAASVVFTLVGGIALAAQGGFVDTAAIVSVSILWGLAAIEAVYGGWMAFSDYQHREEMQRQMQELRKEDANP